jgi:RNA 3'-terminal phosphate cyclase (ATP)
MGDFRNSQVVDGMELVEIDGSFGEGGGQILRTSVSLACILGKRVRVFKIRAGRKEPGLRPQHLCAISSTAEITNSTLYGGKIGSTQIELIPGNVPSKTSKRIDVGTAGSVTLIAQTLIPVAIFRHINLDVEIIGGTEVPASPTVDYIERIALPAYRAMGAESSIQTKRRGYFPKGGGDILLKVDGSKSTLHSLILSEADHNKKVEVISISRGLPEHISRRQLSAAEQQLQSSGLFEIHGMEDNKGDSLSPGTSILVYSQAENEYIGSTVLGERGKKAEHVGSEAAQSYISESRVSPNMDAHLADMMVTLLSCVRGKSRFSTSRLTQHLNTNLAIAKKFTGCEYELKENKEVGNWEVILSGLAEKTN